MIIRPSTPHDIEQVVSLANSYASFDSDVTEADFQVDGAFPNGLLVAEDGHSIVGFVFGYIREIPTAVLERWHASKVAQIELLAVDTSSRGQGVGRLLLDRLLDAFKDEGVDMVLLHCPVEAEAALHLYQETGFEVRAYAMKKRL
jgi:ribosomal protein S18 acetylase RimI-like enzyme